MSFSGDGGGSDGGRGRGRGRGRGKGSGRGSVSNVITPQLDSSLSSEIEAKLSIIETPPPASSEAMTLPSRPDCGTAGTKYVVRANHFLVNLQEEKHLYSYDVSITPEILSRGVNRAVMKDLVSQYRHSHLGGLQPVYDGRKGLFTAGPLPFTLKDFVIKLGEKDEQVPSRREREFKVVIKFAWKRDLQQLQNFLSGRQRDAPRQTIQALDIVLKQQQSKDISVGRSFFSLDPGTITDLGEGLECWRGYYQSLRPTQLGMSLNIDAAVGAFYKAIPVSQYICKLLDIRDSSKPLTDSDCAKVKKALRRLVVDVKHRKDKKHYKISGISEQSADDTMFVLNGGAEKVSVSHFFSTRYSVKLQYGHWPALKAGTDSKLIYLPMEVCTIAVGQRYLMQLNEKQVTRMLEGSCKRPKQREEYISGIALNNHKGNDAFAKEFGINVTPTLVTIPTARVLQPPMMKYNDSGSIVNIRPNEGQWSMHNAKMVSGGTIRHWTCVNFSSCSNSVAVSFSQSIVSTCLKKGMEFNRNPQIPVHTAPSDLIETTLGEIQKQSGGKLQLLIIILPDSSSSYGTIKRICETELGIISQCCRQKNVAKCTHLHLESLALKINVKAGGRNTVLLDAHLRKIPLVTDVPTIIFGADVTHPGTGEDSSPSIAAVVASMDWPEVTTYRGLVSAQTRRQEWIEDLYKVVQDPQKGEVGGGMIRELLMQFYRLNRKRRPERIIFYRDGVGEGMFQLVLLREVDAIRKACASLQDGYLPPITFVVVQKRHHTRLFPADHGNRNLTEKNGNILPGTVVDTHICHPTEFDFYLCSHAGIQGTSRPTHYHVLWDENKFTADLMQTLTNNLCYTYARCTRSVSVVPPVYYAHLAAFRARYYIEGNVSESNTSPATRGINAEICPLPTIKDNVKNVMFYC